MELKSNTEEEGDHLSPEEVTERVESLHLNPPDVRRIKIASERLAYGGVEAEDLRHDATLSLLEGDRKCPREVSFIVFFINAMRSIASNKRKKMIAENFCDPKAQDEDGLPRDEHVISNDLPDKTSLLRDQERMKREIYDSLDETAQLVLLGRLMGDDPNTIKEQLGLSDTEYKTVNTRISRKIKQYHHQGQ